MTDIEAIRKDMTVAQRSALIFICMYGDEKLIDDHIDDSWLMEVARI